MAETTCKINAAKKEAVENIKQYIGGIQSIIFTDFRGLNVAAITSLRNQLKEQESDYRVIKNNYTKIAIGELGLPDVSDFLMGPTALALVRKDAGPVAKSLLNFSKDSSLQIKGGIIGGKLAQIADIEALSKLPGREQLLAILLSAMNAPVQYLAYGLNGIVLKLLWALKAVADQKNQGDQSGKSDEQ
jgi:large subunit ribosomal protein L10